MKGDLILPSSALALIIISTSAFAVLKVVPIDGIRSMTIDFH